MKNENVENKFVLGIDAKIEFGSEGPVSEPYYILIKGEKATAIPLKICMTRAQLEEICAGLHQMLAW
jgi:hypothetical protein